MSGGHWISKDRLNYLQNVTREVKLSSLIYARAVQAIQVQMTALWWGAGNFTLEARTQIVGRKKQDRYRKTIRDQLSAWLKQRVTIFEQAHQTTRRQQWFDVEFEFIFFVQLLRSTSDPWRIFVHVRNRYITSYEVHKQESVLWFAAVSMEYVPIIFGCPSCTIELCFATISTEYVPKTFGCLSCTIVCFTTDVDVNV